MITILVAEDSRSQREFIASFLKKNQFQVIRAKHGSDALEKTFAYHPDVVLLDIIMPHLNGYEVCRRLKAHPSTKDIPVIFCSSQDSEVDRYWGLKQGADAYIAKPFTPEDLMQTIHVVQSAPVS